MDNANINGNNVYQLYNEDEKITSSLIQSTSTSTSSSSTSTSNGDDIYISKDTASSSSSSSTSSTTSTSNGRNVDKIPLILAIYQDIFGRPMTRIQQGEVQRSLVGSCFDPGTPAAYIIYALYETSKAARPSWAYTQAIIRRLEAGSITREEKKRIDCTAYHAELDYCDLVSTEC